jgi:hypothetical protein
MTTARTHLIRLPAGRIRVLRLAFVGGHAYPLRYEVERDEDMCRVCGCTTIYGCAGGCGWANRSHTLCSRCLEKEMLP